MTNIKHTKRALLSSVMALFLCFAMLIGTTYAWFTDSVSSKNTIITAGKLDIDLEYAKVVDGVKTEWAAVEGKEDIFDPNALWEPGRVEVVYLKVSNIGTLALKYQLSVNIYNETAGTNVYGDEFKLSDYLVFTTVEMPNELTAYTDREAATLASGRVEGMKDYNGKTTNLEVNGVDYVALIIYMPETVGNVANYNEDSVLPTIELGINLYATQQAFEPDSYAPDYDNDAWHPNMTVYNAADLKSAIANGGNIKLGADIELTEDWTPVGTSEAPFMGTIDGNGHTISGLTVSDTDYAAFINYAGDNVTIKNLNFENVDIDANKYAAGVVYTAGSGLTLENITISGNIDAVSYAGGLVMEADKVTIKNCENNATVNAKRASGLGSWITNATVENVVNNGDITGTIGAAGIAEAFSGTMKNATNNGNIVATGTEPASGIAGIQKGASTYEYCVNNGDVTSYADNANASAAGILGQTPGSKATLNYCINTGDITAEASYAAGIAYSLYGQITANYCYNSGDVNGADGAGGITPKAQYGSGDKANYCVVDATVTSANKVYNVCNNVNNSYYYAGDELYDKAGTVVDAKTALANLNVATGGVFFKIVDGRITASLEYNWVGDVRVTTVEELQAALDNASEGETVIAFGADITGYVTVLQKVGVNITIEGAGYNYDGTITIHGGAQGGNSPETLTIKNVNFVTSESKDFIDCNSQESIKRYAHNVTIDNCTFTNEGDGIVVPARLRQTYNMTIKNCEVIGTFSPVWATGGFGLTIDNVTANCTDEGIHVGTTDDVVIKNCNITVSGANGYGVRADATGAYTMTITNCTFDAANVIVLRNAVAGYTATIDGKIVVYNQASLQAALDNATDGTVLYFANDIAGDVTATQKSGVKVTIEGNGKTFAGVLLVDGKSATYTTAGLTVKNVVFKADSISADACIRLGDGTTATRYTCNVTVDGCTFDVPGAVGVKSYTGGDKNLTITGCTATANAHSLVQAKGIDGILVQKCEVNSKNGLNFNNSTNVTVDECTVDVKGYAVRFGESSGGEGAAEVYFIKNCSLKSANDDGDATIILRGTADNSTLTIVNTTIEGTPDITNTATGATVVK